MSDHQGPGYTPHNKGNFHADNFPQRNPIFIIFDLILLFAFLVFLLVLVYKVEGKPRGRKATNNTVERKASIDLSDRNETPRVILLPAKAEGTLRKALNNRVAKLPAHQRRGLHKVSAYSELREPAAIVSGVSTIRNTNLNQTSGFDSKDSPGQDHRPSIQSAHNEGVEKPTPINSDGTQLSTEEIIVTDDEYFDSLNNTPEQSTQQSSNSPEQHRESDPPNKTGGEMNIHAGITANDDTNSDIIPSSALPTISALISGVNNAVLGNGRDREDFTALISQHPNGLNELDDSKAISYTDNSLTASNIGQQIDIQEYPEDKETKQIQEQAEEAETNLQTMDSSEDRSEDIERDSAETARSASVTAGDSGIDDSAGNERRESVLLTSFPDLISDNQSAVEHREVPEKHSESSHAPENTVDNDNDVHENAVPADEPPTPSTPTHVRPGRRRGIRAGRAGTRNIHLGRKRTETNAQTPHREKKSSGMSINIPPAGAQTPSKATPYPQTPAVSTPSSSSSTKPRQGSLGILEAIGYGSLTPKIPRTPWTPKASLNTSSQPSTPQISQTPQTPADRPSFFQFRDPFPGSPSSPYRQQFQMPSTVRNMRSKTESRPQASDEARARRDSDFAARFRHGSSLLRPIEDSPPKDTHTAPTTPQVSDGGDPFVDGRVPSPDTPTKSPP
ncbi:hypothetical protein ACLMJK_009598 [Lecanora helva]